MKKFENTLKLYDLGKKDLISLSIRSSADHVLTFYIHRSIFEQIKIQYKTKLGYLKSPYLIHKKQDYIRFTHQADFETNLRIDTLKWESLLADYEEKKQPQALVTSLPVWFLKARFNPKKIRR